MDIIWVKWAFDAELWEVNISWQSVNLLQKYILNDKC